MNCFGSGFIAIIDYSGASSAAIAIQNPILTEANIDLLAEDSNYLEVETI